MTTFSEQFPIVFQALNVGFLQTLNSGSIFGNFTGHIF